MVTSVQARCGSCSWGGRGAPHVFPLRALCPIYPSWPMSQKREPISVASRGPWKSLSPPPFATGLRFSLNPEKMLKKQRCGMTVMFRAGKMQLQWLQEEKSEHWRRPVSPQCWAGCARWVSVSHITFLPLPPSSGQQGLQRRWAHHWPPAPAAVSFHAPMNGLGREKWGLWHIFPN